MYKTVEIASKKKLPHYQIQKKTTNFRICNNLQHGIEVIVAEQDTKYTFFNAFLQVKEPAGNDNHSL